LHRAIRASWACIGGPRNMSADRSRPSESEKARAWQSILVAAVDGAAEEGGRVLVSEGLVHLIGAIAAGSAGGAVVATVAALFRQLFDQSKATAKQLRVILDEPFQTAARTLRDIASVEIRTRRERHECQRQLAQAFDNFSKARSYAERHDPARLQLIDIYQALTAALMTGGRPFAQLYLAPWQADIRRWRAEANRLRTEANVSEENMQEAIQNLEDTRRELEMLTPITSPNAGKFQRFPTPSSVIVRKRIDEKWNEART
jgi:hypothetical protein